MGTKDRTQQDDWGGLIGVPLDSMHDTMHDTMQRLDQ